MNIYVGNLAYQVDEDELKKAFGAFGNVDSVRIISDRQTGRSKGFAFVEMTSSDDAQEAITKLNKTELGGRELTVNEARPRPPRDDSRGGGSRGGRGGAGGGGYGNRY